MSNKLYEFNITVGRMLEEIKLPREQYIIFMENNEKVYTDVQALKSKIDDLEQKSLDKAIEVVGVQISPNKDCKLLINELLKKIRY